MNFQTQFGYHLKVRPVPWLCSPQATQNKGARRLQTRFSGAGLAGQQLASVQKPVSVVVSILTACAHPRRAGQMAAGDLPGTATRCWDAGGALRGPVSRQGGCASSEPGLELLVGGHTASHLTAVLNEGESPASSCTFISIFTLRFWKRTAARSVRGDRGC